MIITHLECWKSELVNTRDSNWLNFDYSWYNNNRAQYLFYVEWQIYFFYLSVSISWGAATQDIWPHGWLVVPGSCAVRTDLWSRKFRIMSVLLCLELKFFLNIESTSVYLIHCELQKNMWHLANLKKLKFNFLPYFIIIFAIRLFIQVLFATNLLSLLPLPLCCSMLIIFIALITFTCINLA